MGKRMECPRCGAGISHTDSQCWRCGEMFKTVKAVPPSETLPVKISQASPVKEGTTVIKRAPSPAVIRSLNDVNGSREKEIREREDELRKKMDTLDADSKELDEAIQEYEEDRLDFEKRKEEVRSREEEIEARALALEDAIRSIEGFINGTRSGEKAQESLKRLTELYSGIKPLIDEERERIRKEMEHEMADKISRISQLEEQLKAAAEAGTDFAPDLFANPALSADELARSIAGIKEEIARQLADAGPRTAEDKRVPTHIGKFDQVLAGGFPKGGIYLINGPAGAMKSTIGYSILHSNAYKHGTPGMYFSLEQDRGSIIRQMERMGMSRNDSSDKMMIVDLVDLRKSMIGQTGDWRQVLMRYVNNVMEDKRFELLVLDSLESFTAMNQHPFSRSEIQDLFEWLRSLDLTTFVISETPMRLLETEEHMELFVADGAVEIQMREVGDSKVQRWIKCVKMRGANVDTRYYCLLHEGTEFTISMPMMRSTVTNFSE